MFLLDLVTHVGVAIEAKGASKNRTREARARLAFQKDIDRFLRGLREHQWKLPAYMTQQAFDLLEAMKNQLAPPPRRKRTVGYPTLQDFACSILVRYRIADDPALILEFAELTGLDCDARTAQRYLKEARKA
jgi:hypothetical protein